MRMVAVYASVESVLQQTGAAHLMATDQASRTVRAAAASATDPNAAWKALRRASPLTCRQPQASLIAFTCVAPTSGLQQLSRGAGLAPH